MSNYRNDIFDNRGSFSEFDGVYSDVDAHLNMLKDQDRCEGFFKAIKKYCKDKVVCDFGAGSGLLGVYALMSGAKEVWFVEREVTLHPLIKRLCETNGDFDEGIEFHICVNSSQIPDERNYFDVIISETIGDSGIECDFTYEYGKIARKHPNSICIPDRIEYYWTSIYEEEIQKEMDYLKDFPVNYLDIGGKGKSPFLPFIYMRGCKVRDKVDSIENKFHTLDIKNYPQDTYVDMKFNLNNDSLKDEHNFIVLYWRCFTEDLEIVNKSLKNKIV